MWEIAEAMINWDLCNKCGCALEVEWQGLPINCDSCHDRHLMTSDQWIFSKTYHKKLEKSKDTMMSLRAVLSYNAYIKWVKRFNDWQVKLVNTLIQELLLEDYD